MLEHQYDTVAVNAAPIITLVKVWEAHHYPYCSLAESPGNDHTRAGQDSSSNTLLWKGRTPPLLHCVIRLASGREGVPLVCE